jgi:hypothetical protein
MGTDRNLRRLSQAARRAERRERVSSSLATAARYLPFALLATAALLGYAKLSPPDGSKARLLVSVAVVAFAAVFALVAREAFRRRPRLEGAMALDRHHDLRGRVANALAFSGIPASERTPFMELAIADALEHTPKLEPARAVPLRAPRETGLVVLLVAGIALLASFEVKRLRYVPPPQAKAPMLMTTDDLELFKSVAEELAQAKGDEAHKAAVASYNRLIEDIANRRIDRHEVFRRLSGIEAELGRDLEANREALNEGLEGLARELNKSELTRKAAQALEDKKLPDAEAALRELAEKLQKKQLTPSKAELDRLRQALEKASAQSKDRLSAIESRRRELNQERESLLKKKRESPDAAAGVDRKLEENQRKLERLERESQKAQRSAGQLSELDKELAKAAEALRKEMGEGAKGIERSAEQMNRMAQKQLSDQEKRELIRRMEELRQVLRQQNQGGENRKKQLERFSQRARGGKQGKGGEGEGQQGKGSGKPGEIRLSSGGQRVEIPGTGQGKSGSEGSPSESPGGGEPGRGYGKGHDPNVAGEEATSFEGKTHDVTAAGIDSGEGTASAEVIYGAAERGFTSKGYKDIFVEYETVAEQVIEKDDIPPGYRFYVRRYFQLIRPRD